MNHNNMVNRYFLPALKSAGIEQIRFRDLRHTYASLLIKQGKNIKYIQIQLGHPTATATPNVYAYLMKLKAQAAAIKIGECNFELKWTQKLKKALTGFP